MGFGEMVEIEQCPVVVVRNRTQRHVEGLEVWRQHEGSSAPGYADEHLTQIALASGHVLAPDSTETIDASHSEEAGER